MPRALSLAMSGKGSADFTLEELREMVSDYGFEKEDVDEDAPQWRKADVTRFLELYRVESVNAFKARFAAEKLQPPSRVKAAPAGPPKLSKPPSFRQELPSLPSFKGRASETRMTIEPTEKIDCTPPDESHFEEISRTWRDLKWKRVQRAGGDFTQSDDWLRLYAAEKQAVLGDCVGDRPSVDPESPDGADLCARARFDAWAALRGLSRPEAVRRFLRVFAEAHAAGRERTNFRAKQLDFM